GPHPLNEGLDLALAAGDLDHQLLRTDIHDASAKKLDQLAEFAALAPRRRIDLEQHQSALDEIARADFIDLDYGDNLFKLLADLIQNAVVADNDECHPREVRVLRLADGQRIDVIPARGEH